MAESFGDQQHDAMGLPSPEADAIDAQITSLSQRQTNRGLRGLDSGFRLFNKVTGGLPTGLTVIAGPPGCGKTTFAKQLSDQVAEIAGVPVLYFSFEQSADELRVMSLARLSRVNNREVVRGPSNDIHAPYPGAPIVKAWDEVQKAVPKYKLFARRMRIVEAGRHETIDKVREVAEKVRQIDDAERMLIVVDHLQAIPCDLPLAPEDREAQHCSELRRLGRDLKSPVVALSSERLEGYFQNRRPNFEAFGDRDGLPYSADIAAYFWTNPTTTTQFRNQGTIEVPDFRRGMSLYILKNRLADPVHVKMIYRPDLCSFTEADRTVLSYTDGFVSE
ncbi:Replicative DNA helicase [Planctomycetes bacterium Pan216]|uniref:Replicative DNA helicase n=1 Tax=Kolteria novifilia TaxID=2527975 RepID=A0A518B5M4_9BACT|nr:Replicative DNA helicase [Planctomycetes bacterium Pan216]